MRTGADFNVVKDRNFDLPLLRLIPEVKRFISDQLEERTTLEGDGRLEIKSPGRLPNIVTVDNIFTTRFARNPVISRVLTEMELVRELNEGVPRVFKEMQEAGLPEPKIVETAANVTVVLYKGKTVSSSDNPSDTRLLENLSANLSVTQQKILKMIEGRTYTNASNAAELLHISRNSVNAAISVLKEKRLIERIGEDKGGHWEIVKK
jgi:Predicted transcriptional regulator containing an HTH domain and an uncharacterized domain shared with the mammalian protein Schlafen